MEFMEGGRTMAIYRMAILPTGPTPHIIIYHKVLSYPLYIMTSTKNRVSMCIHIGTRITVSTNHSINIQGWNVHIITNATFMILAGNFFVRNVFVWVRIACKLCKNCTPHNKYLIWSALLKDDDGSEL